MAVKSGKSSVEKAAMKVNGKNFMIRKDVQDEAGELTRKYYQLKVFPKYEEDLFTSKGQPLLNRIVDPQWPRLFLSEAEIRKTLLNEPFP